MTDGEILNKWKIGCKWLTAREQISNTNKNNLGEIYDHKIYLVALKRLEAIEDELMKRNIIYG